MMVNRRSPSPAISAPWISPYAVAVRGSYNGSAALTDEATQTGPRTQRH
jgi:hypothetical protein